jgi:hypothetical protein
MKNSLVFKGAFIVLLFMIGCSSKSVNEDNGLSSSYSNSMSVDCDKFLNDYEEFMDKYIAMIKKNQKNPNDMSIMTDYTSMMTEVSEWAERADDCADDTNFASKFLDIQMKVSKAASGL